MAKKTSNSKRKSPRSSNKPVGKVSVTVLFLLLVLSVVSVATFQRYAFAETDLFPLWYVALGEPYYLGVGGVSEKASKP